MNTAALADTLSRLPQLGQPVFIGLDGFVDRLLRVVENASTQSDAATFKHWRITVGWSTPPPD